MRVGTARCAVRMPQRGIPTSAREDARPTGIGPIPSFHRILRLSVTEFLVSYNKSPFPAKPSVPSCHGNCLIPPR